MRQAGFALVMARLGPWNMQRRVAVAVSGGADSLCLAWLARGWGQPFGLIVDHGLRPGSGMEAQEAALRLAGFGVPSRVLRLRVPPGPGLAARARAMRYAALAEASAEAGLLDVLLGHHAADQAETVLMRRAARSGPAGLAGMAAIVETPRLRLVRPLLGVAPDALRAVLRSVGIGWTEDPSNADPAAARARARLDLARDEALARDLLERAAAHAGVRSAREGEMAGVLARRAALHPEGWAYLAPGPIDADCLATLLRALAGAAYPARGTALARLAAAPAPATLGGVRLLAAGRLGPGLLLVREEAAMQPPIPAARGSVWDGRFTLEFDGVLPAGTMLGALGGDAARLPRARRPDVSLPDAVRRSLPALRTPDGGLAVPHLGQFSGWTNRSVRLSFAPPNPACGAPFHGLPDGGAEAPPDHHVR